jgi:hypothetical protein
MHVHRRREVATFGTLRLRNYGPYCRRSKVILSPYRGRSVIKP